MKYQVVTRPNGLPGTSYFLLAHRNKCMGVVMFDDHDVLDVERAWTAAVAMRDAANSGINTEVSGRVVITVFRPLTFGGPWSAAGSAVPGTQTWPRAA